jgi:membrane protease YdiL (CAAX protease family)
MQQDGLTGISALAVDLIKAHTLQFERPLARVANRGATVRFLVAFLIVGVGLLWLGREIVARMGSGDPLAARFGLVVALLVGALALGRVILGPNWSALGLRPPATWTRREALYAATVIPAVCVIFSIVFHGLLTQMLTTNGLARFLLFNLAFGLIWGVYQEIAYRGLVQPILAAYLGPVGGLVATNILFTFGPLHASIWTRVATDPNAATMFIPIFGIGLVFGIIYWRTGNLWLPAIFHGLWPLNMVG